MQCSAVDSDGMGWDGMEVIDRHWPQTDPGRANEVAIVVLVVVVVVVVMVTVDDGVSGARKKAIKSSAAAEAADLHSPSIETMSIVTLEPPPAAAWASVFPEKSADR